MARNIRTWGWVWQPAFSHRYLNRFYDKQVDPFRFASNPYEAEKYAHTIRLLDGRRYDRALEIGAAEGVFTERLAPLCKSVVAIEIAKAAVERARTRLQAFNNVSFIQAAIPEQLPQGNFDLIVASDVLYYFPADVLIDIAQKLAAKLEPGGILFALHYLGHIGQPISGGKVHELLKRHSQLEEIHDETVVGVGPKAAGYTITIFRKP